MRPWVTTLPLLLAGCLAVDPDSRDRLQADPVLHLQDREPAEVLAQFPIGTATAEDLLNTLSVPHERRASEAVEEWIYIGTRPGEETAGAGHYIITLQNAVVQDVLWTGGGPCEGFTAIEVQSGERSC